MNSQWLTILMSNLMSKGLELDGQVRKQMQTTKDLLKEQLEQRGIRVSASDLAAIVEEVAPAASRAAVSYVVDFMRPFAAGMGLRFARLSDTQVEVVLPLKTRNALGETEEFHAGAVTTAAIEAVRALWMRHAPLGEFKIEVISLNADFIANSHEDCRLRAELVEEEREECLTLLRSQQEATSEMDVQVVTERDQVVAKIYIKLKLHHTPAIG